MKRLIPFLVVFAFVYNASASPLNISAEILTSITIPDLSPFDFGSIIGGVVGGTLTFDGGGANSPAPNIRLLGDDQGGVARLVSVNSPPLATVTIYVTTLASEGGTTMIVTLAYPGG
jgi:hypothetical protein